MTTDLIKFTAIIICFGIAASAGRAALAPRDYALVAAALFFTLVADFFLVVLHIYPAGVAVFCIVQALYNVRFGGIARLKILPAALVIPIVVFAATGDGLIAIALLYAQLFILSYAAMVAALRRSAFPAPNAVLIFIGMTAFVLCDISVAVWNLELLGIAPDASITNFAQSAVWLFYTPSQICLALSSRQFVAADRALNPISE